METRLSDRRTVRQGLLWTVALFVVLVVPGCAPGRVGGRPAAAPGSTQPAPTTGPSPAPSPSPSPTPERIEFAKQIRPLLEEKCSPCHFPGGRMYERLPFDQEGTVRVLGTAMFTRLRDPVDQDLVRTFLAQAADEPGSHPVP